MIDLYRFVGRQINEYGAQAKIEVVEENLYLCLIFHYKTHVDWTRIEHNPRDRYGKDSGGGHRGLTFRRLMSTVVDIPHR